MKGAELELFQLLGLWFAPICKLPAVFAERMLGEAIAFCWTICFFLQAQIMITIIMAQQAKAPIVIPVTAPPPKETFWAVLVSQIPFTSS